MAVIVSASIVYLLEHKWGWTAAKNEPNEVQEEMKRERKIKKGEKKKNREQNG